ncbi:MAG: hypothetical protein LIO95_05005 [Clostridiales bacterium]|nr:hypothetical protein [Clostridiales bacterium]
MKINNEIYSQRNNFCLMNGNTTMPRDDFEHYFTRTKEKITFTFNDWDGKSYDGESRTARVYRLNFAGFEDVKFIKVGKGLHYIDEERMVPEKATGISHPEAFWFADVARA